MSVAARAPGRRGVPDRDGAAAGRLRDAGIPAYAFPEDAARALGAAARRASRARAPDSPRAEVRPAPRRDEAAAMLAGRSPPAAAGWSPEDVAALARCYGLPFVAGGSTRTPAEAADAAGARRRRRVKAVGPGLLHKTDVGAVRLALRGRAAVLRAARAMQSEPARRRPRGRPASSCSRWPRPASSCSSASRTTRSSGRWWHAPQAARRPSCSPTPSVRLAPLSERDVHEMPRALATFPLLAGHRGAPPADVAALEDVLRRISALADDHPVDRRARLQPVVVLTPAGAAIVDMRVRVHAAAAADPSPPCRGASS